jgi:hypothetical protein
MSYVHWQFQTANGDAKVMTHEEFAGTDLDKVLAVISVEEKIHMLAVSSIFDSVAKKSAVIRSPNCGSNRRCAGHGLVDHLWCAAARSSPYQDV